MSELRKSHSGENTQNTRLKLKRKTVGMTLPPNLIKKARKHRLNISRITEQALNSILDYLETQNRTESSRFLSSGSSLKESKVPRAGFEPATTRSSAGCSPRLSYLSDSYHNLAYHLFKFFWKVQTPKA